MNLDGIDSEWNSVVFGDFDVAWKNNILKTVVDNCDIVLGPEKFSGEDVETVLKNLGSMEYSIVKPDLVFHLSATPVNLAAIPQKSLTYPQT